MDIRIYQRNDLFLKVTVVDELGVPIDLTGADLVFECETLYGKQVFKKTVGAGIIINDAQAGEIEILISSEDTNIQTGKYRVELLMIDIDGHRYTVETGHITVVQSIIEEAI